jgi:hypothetical protein
MAILATTTNGHKGPTMERCTKEPQAKIDTSRRQRRRATRQFRRAFLAITHAAINNLGGSLGNPLDYGVLLSLHTQSMPLLCIGDSMQMRSILTREKIKTNLSACLPWHLSGDILWKRAFFAKDMAGIKEIGLEKRLCCWQIIWLLELLSCRFIWAHKFSALMSNLSVHIFLRSRKTYGNALSFKFCIKTSSVGSVRVDWKHETLLYLFIEFFGQRYFFSNFYQLRRTCKIGLQYLKII